VIESARSSPAPSTSLTTSSPIAACTIVAKSYIAFARVLACSFRQHHPEIPFFLLLADEVDGWFDPACEPFQMLRLSELEIARLERFRFQYAQQTLSYAATPYLLSRLLARGFERVLFFKQESLVLGPITSFIDVLARRSIVLTPHLLTPLTGPDRIARELNILQSGTFNVGMLGVARTSTAGRFLDWWQDKVATHCRHAVSEGMHYEQRWLDLVPAYFDDVHVLRDPSYNIGHWNLPDRAVSVRGDAVLVDGQPCRLFRFSGYDPGEPFTVTRYSCRLTWENVGPAREVFNRFRLELEKADYHATKDWPYAYGAFDNGVTIPDVARALYLQLGDDAGSFGDPLRSTGPGSYFSWLTSSVDNECGSRCVTRLWYGIHRSRPDLQAAFPDPLGADRDAFLDWATTSGMAEQRLSTRFASPGRSRDAVL
jgi:hypothetical protein